MLILSLDMRMEIVLLERRKKAQPDSQWNKIFPSKRVSSCVCKIESSGFHYLAFFFQLDGITLKYFFVIIVLFIFGPTQLEFAFNNFGVL